MKLKLGLVLVISYLWIVKGEPCTTPEGGPGKCVSQSDCPHIMSLLSQPNEEIKTFVQNSKCDGPDESSVCCGDQPPNLKPSASPICTSTVAPPYPGSRCCGTDTHVDDLMPYDGTADIDQFPWTALVEYRRKETIQVMCGGTLISGRYVLTAAHCVSGPVLQFGTPINVRLGEYDTSNSLADEDCDLLGDCTLGPVVIPIEKITVHEEFKSGNRKIWHDIALIRLKDMAPYTDFIRPICLPQTDVTSSSLTDISFDIAGWGLLNLTHKSPVKRYGEIPYVNIDACKPFYNNRGMELWSGQICAGGEVTKGTCRQFEPGEPLMYNRGVNTELVGIVSLGVSRCDKEGVPGVYTKIYEYLPWIRKNTEP